MKNTTEDISFIPGIGEHNREDAVGGGERGCERVYHATRNSD